MTRITGSTNSKIQLARRGVRGLKPYQPGKPVAELEREYGVRAAIKLASNENPLGPGNLVREATQNISGLLCRYPDGNGYGLKQALCRQLELEPEQITLGNGSNDVLELLARAFVSARTEVIFSEHAFAVYPIVTQAVGGQAVVTPAREWGHDLDAMAAAVTPKTRMVFIANPNNPTGTWVKRDALRAFIARMPSHVIVVVDEAYFEYVQEDDYPDALQWLSEFDNLVVTRTFSKIHALAGLRVGYAVSHPDIAELLNRVRQPFNVNSIGLLAAEAALADEEHVQRSREVNNMGLRQMSEGFESLGLGWIPSVGNFVCVDVGRSGDEVYEALLTRGVIARPVTGYGLPRHLRVTVGLERENRRFLAALQKVLEQTGP